MDFGKALNAIKNGNRVYRETWGMFLECPDYRSHNPNPSIYIVTSIKNHQKMVPWVPSSADMLAKDWKIMQLIPEADRALKHHLAQVEEYGQYKPNMAK